MDVRLQLFVLKACTSMLWLAIAISVPEEVFVRRGSKRNAKLLMDTLPI